DTGNLLAEGSHLLAELLGDDEIAPLLCRRQLAPGFVQLVIELLKVVFYVHRGLSWVGTDRSGGSRQVYSNPAGFHAGGTLPSPCPPGGGWAYNPPSGLARPQWR